jgi:hypothetical protein
MRKRIAIAVAIAILLSVTISHFGMHAMESVAPESNYAVTTDPYLPVQNLD